MSCLCLLIRRFFCCRLFRRRSLLGHSCGLLRGRLCCRGFLCRCLSWSRLLLRRTLESVCEQRSRQRAQHVGGIVIAAAKQAASIVALLPANNLAGPALFDFAAPSKALDLVKYSAADAIAALADEGSTVELYAGYGKNIVTALATINGSAVGILATEKAALCHKCTAKAARFVRLCDAYSIPVVTVVNTEGFGKSEGDDQAGGIRQAARMAGVYAEATTVKVAVLAGEAVGPAYTVFAACADWRVAVQGCTVAPLAPEAAVTVLYKDEIFASDNIVNATKAKAAAYAKEVCSANAAVANGAADAIADAATARGAVAQALDMLASKRTVRLAKKHGNITL